MADWRKLAMASILVDDKVDDAEAKLLAKELKGASGKIEEEGIKFLVELRNTAHKKKKEVSDAFDKFFFKVITDNVLKDNKIDASEASWLKTTLFADKKIDDGEMAFLNNLNKKAKSKSPEFEALYNECATMHKKAAAKK
jgi:hypothetical protein